MEQKRYNSLNQYFRSHFNCRAHKVPIDGGFTCPNRDGTIGTGGCIYCNSTGSGTGAVEKNLSIAEQMKSGIKFQKRRFKAKKFIAYFQSYSNTYDSVEKLKEKYDEALMDELVAGIAVGTRPDCLNDEILDLLKSYKDKGYMVWLELGLQSIHEKTLKFINRCHSYNDFLTALKKVKEKDISVCVHIIFGLPGESHKEMMETIEALAQLPIDGIKFHELYIVKGTIMEKLYIEGKYVPLTREEYIELVCQSIAILPKNIVIQRLTGDPMENEVVAPIWALDKYKTIELIDENLINKDLFQGKFNNNE